MFLFQFNSVAIKVTESGADAGNDVHNWKCCALICMSFPWDKDYVNACCDCLLIIPLPLKLGVCGDVSPMLYILSKSNVINNMWSEVKCLPHFPVKSQGSQGTNLSGGITQCSYLSLYHVAMLHCRLRSKHFLVLYFLFILVFNFLK